MHTLNHTGRIRHYEQEVYLCSKDLTVAEATELRKVVQNTNRAANCMMRGPEVTVGVPKALSPVDWGTRHCGTPAPQMAMFLETANCCVRTAVTLPRLRTLNASQLSSSFVRSFFNGTARVSRVSRETVLGKVNVLRPMPGVRSLAKLPSKFKSKFTNLEYGCPD